MLRSYALHDDEIGYCQGQGEGGTGALAAARTVRAHGSCLQRVRRAHPPCSAPLSLNVASLRLPPHPTSPAFAAGMLLMYVPEEAAFRLYCRLLDAPPRGAGLRRLYQPGLEPLKCETWELRGGLYCAGLR